MKPVLINWEGPLIVVPAPREPLRPQSTHDAIVRLVSRGSKPVHMQMGDGWIDSTVVAYQLDKEFAWVDGSADRPVQMADARGSVLTTPQLRYSHSDGHAVLRGPSSAVIKTEQGGKPQTINATWTERAGAMLTGSAGESSLTSLRLDGNVVIKHPQIRKFSAGALAMEFAPAKGSKAAPQVQQIIASENVDCAFEDKAAKVRAIRAQKLVLDMVKDEKGEPYPHHIKAEGSVVAGDEQEEIRAESIDADLSPAAGKSNEDSAQLAGLEKLVAAGNVQLKSAKGELVKGDRLQVRQSAERSSWYLLEGNPATVAQKGSSLSAGFIEIDTASEQALITGGGKLVLASAKKSAGKELLYIA